VNLAAAIFVALTAGGVPLGVVLGKTLLSALMTAVFTPVLLFFLMHVRWLTRG
jgi:hypothetical protein